MWKLVIEEKDLPFLSLRFLGLTFFERRLREARTFGIQMVYVVAPARGFFRLPELRNEKLCATWALLTSIDEIPVGQRENSYSVPLLGLIEKVPPYRMKTPLQNETGLPLLRKKAASEIIENITAGWVAKKINKPISLFLSLRLSDTFVTPNLWSLFNLLVGMLSGVCVAQEGYAWPLVGGLLIQMASIFDGVDGEIAKFRLESSQFGAWVDTAVDNLSLFAFLVGLGAHVSLYSSFSKVHLTALLTVGAFSVSSLVLVLAYFVSKKLGSGSLATYDSQFLSKLPDTDSMVFWMRKIKQLIKKDFFSLLFFVFCLLGWTTELIYVAALGPLIALVCVFYLNTKYSGMVIDVAYEAETDRF